MEFQSGKSLKETKIRIQGGYSMMNDTAKADFSIYGHLWDKNVIEGLLERFNRYRSSQTSINSDRCFIEFVLELDQSYSTFLQDMRDLPMIINCRATGNTTSCFGGNICANLMKNFNNIAKKYLNSDSCSQTSHGDVIRQIAVAIRDKSHEDEKYAWELEESVKKEYLSSGVDKTLNIFRKAGYNV